MVTEGEASAVATTADREVGKSNLILADIRRLLNVKMKEGASAMLSL